jgi:dTDP-4-amino-4,6-dideoxygalactose transaminase
MKYKIPFNKPYIIGKELYYIAETVLNGHTSGDGEYTKKCHKLLEKKFKAKKVLLTHSCTAALEVAALLCDILPGDEIILPSFTFVSTANAFYLRNAKLVFVDINPDTLNIDVQQIKSAISSRTKAIVPVHYGGVGCEMDEIAKLSKNNSIYIIEDAAQGVNSKYKGEYLGTIGDFGAYSFHETKNIISGEGGALIINNEKFIERAEIIREKGTNRSKFYRGEVDKYTWVDIGSSFLPSDIIAAFLYAQIENIDIITNKRIEIFNFYYEALLPLADQGKIKLPHIVKNGVSNCHIFYILLKDEKERDSLMEFLKERSIFAVFHYLPLHLSHVGQTLGYSEGQLPITEKVSQTLLRLPFFFEITKKQQNSVVNAIFEFFKK